MHSWSSADAADVFEIFVFTLDPLSIDRGNGLNQRGELTGAYYRM